MRYCKSIILAKKDKQTDRQTGGNHTYSPLLIHRLHVKAEIQDGHDASFCTKLCSQYFLCALGNSKNEKRVNIH